MARDKHGYGKTGYSSHVHDPPWLDRGADPTYVCESCGKGYNRPDQRTIEVDLTTLKKVRRCPRCDAVVSEHTSDMTEGYLRAWREDPGSMHSTIDQYTDLKDI